MGKSVVCFLSLIGISFQAHAYLDAGTGSMLLQLLFGGFAAVAAVAKLYWHKISGLFSKKVKIEESENKENIDSQNQQKLNEFGK